MQYLDPRNSLHRFKMEQSRNTALITALPLHSPSYYSLIIEEIAIVDIIEDIAK